MAKSIMALKLSMKRTEKRGHSDVSNSAKLFTAEIMGLYN